MASALLRLVMLVALALMPFSMAGAPAAALAATPDASAGHCTEHQKPADAPSTPKAHCATCAALPVLEAATADLELRPVLLLQVEADNWITEPGPETDTPPPKLS